MIAKIKYKIYVHNTDAPPHPLKTKGKTIHHNEIINFLQVFSKDVYNVNI